MFQKAERKRSKLRLAISGPSGAGKTYGALSVAMGLGGKIAFIDTERGSASLYSNLTDFDVLEINPPYTPERFIEALKAAEAAGYATVIIDSITHEWNGAGGCLTLVDQIAQAKFKGNTWSAWNVVTPRHQAFLDAILQSKCHVIVTMRSKTETSQIEENGRKKVVKLGTKAEQRDGIEYEFTTVLDLVHEGHYALASKDRTGMFAGDPVILSPEVGKRLVEWLESGAEPAPDTAIRNMEPKEIPNSSTAKQVGTWDEIKAKINSAENVADLDFRYLWFKERIRPDWIDSLSDLYDIRRNEIIDALHDAGAPTFTQEEAGAQ